MKYFLDSSRKLRAALLGALVLTIAAGAFAELPWWIRNVEGKSALEAVLFRMMSLPSGAVAFRRPPHETRPALGELIKSQPRTADLYSIRALEDEQDLDFKAAEADWKTYVENASDKSAAQLALADFYHRRLQPADEIKTLSLIANAPPLATEKLTPVPQQRSWHAFERMFTVIDAQGLPKDVSIAQYHAWIKRYPSESSLYAKLLQFLVTHKEYTAAASLIDEYRKQFPKDQVFPLKAKAMVEYQRGSVQAGLSVYQQSFQPLWDPQLVKSYFDLLRDTQNLRKFRDDAHAALLANPQDLNAAARLFYYYQQQGKLDAAQQIITDFRLRKDASHAAWTSQELFVCARLLEDIHQYPESARYYFALYNSKEMPDAQERALAALTGILLTAPETSIRFGSGELSMYRDIATMDQGPGYLNGILSLLLNTTQPGSQYSDEEQRAEPYFHRAKAVELLVMLDSRFPNSSRRPQLHAQLLEFYANNGEGEAVIQGGKEFLATLPNAEERTAIALLMADAYARKGDTKNEFAIYDSVLQELSAKAENVPLGSGNGVERGETVTSYREQNYEGDESESQEYGEANSAPRHRASQSFELQASGPASGTGGPRSPEYSRVLERYLARLVETKQIPAALGVLRHEIDRNPDDPGLYERTAVFLDQNRLGAQQEEIYRLAVSRFSDKSWYDKLARFYLRHKRDGEFEQLTREAIAKFQGSELESYFQNVVGGSPQLYLRLNLFANQRFPHNPVFVRNLLSAYSSPQTHDAPAWEALLRQHWFEDAQLRSEFFEFLSRNRKLEGELNAIRESAPNAGAWEKNPAAAMFLAQGELWRSHFESSAPALASLAAQYPAEADIVHTASSVYRSLAYFEPANTAIAAKMEDRFLQANPADTETMARIGDIFADRDQFASAAPYWERMPMVAPGTSSGYLDAATIYWDYFDFDNAMRLLEKGRARLNDPNLYSYEAGAIFENRRDYAHAIPEYVKGALAAPDSSAEGRLLQLARRPKFRELVDQSTANIATPPNPSMAAVNLRIKILEAQERKPEMESFLDSIVSTTNSIEQAEDIETLAQQKSLEAVRQHAIEKQAALTTDPVTRMQLRYALIQLYEGRKDFNSAQKNIEALYRENPRILGVVRSTVDFYWRMKMQSEAIAVLLQASKDAYPDLRMQFTYEAARKSTEARKFDQARELLSGLLKQSPYNSEYLAAMADTYAQAGDDRGLEKFYTDQIAAFRNAPLSADARKAQIATLRRGLILALTRLGEYSAAVDQYIELINKFPEDDPLVTEAALYALRYKRQQQLVDFYAKTVAQSPRDYRWSMVLARTYTNLENYPAAIDTYAKSIAIRPDRSDLYTARVELEERLMRFDDAANDYQQLYQLAFHDTQWLEKLAAVRARQGRANDAVTALRSALIEGRPENPANYFEVARRLETWGMLEQSRSFAEQGIQKTGSDTLAEAQYVNGVRSYVRIMTRLRQHDRAYATLQQGLRDADANLPVLKEQVERQGIGGLSDAQWRERARTMRLENARLGMASALQEMGNAVNTYFTPEERQAFAQFAESKYHAMTPDDAERFAIPLAVSAALAEQEAHWRFDAAMHRAAQPNHYLAVQPLVDLQRRRGRFTELAGQMEQVAAAVPRIQKSSALIAAADAYYSAADSNSELRILSTLFSLNELDNNRQQRFFRLLLEKQPQELVRVASQWPSPTGEAAANYVVANGNAALAHAVVEARSKPRPAVWNKAYNSLVGLYFAEPKPEVNNAFISLLGDEPISARLSRAVDRDRQLAGNQWFYYSSRYGEYLGATKLGHAEDFLPAIVEESPVSGPSYTVLADYYMSAGDTAAAIADYQHTLELVPDQPAIYNSLALAYYKQGDRPAALAQWKQAFTALLKQLNSSRVPESFWQDFGRTCDQLRQRRLFAELKPDADTIVRTYLRHNGTWRSNAVLHSAYAAQGDASAATAWLLDIASAAPDPAAVLADVADISWIPQPQRSGIYQRILTLKENALGKLDGIERQNARQDLASWQERWITYLVHAKRYDDAAAALSALSADARQAQGQTLVPLELQVAAKLGTLDEKLAGYRAQPQTMPSAEILRSTAKQIFASGDKQSARKILELVFAREIEEHRLIASNFLGLAEIRLVSGDTPGALELLHRLVLVVGIPFENLDSAAALLEKTGHNAEAVEFLDQLVKSAPWESSYRFRLAKARIATGSDAANARQSLVTIASSQNSTYDLRLKSAASLVGAEHPDLGSGELNLIASAAPSSPAADKFYFYEARIKAAEHVSDAKARMELLSHCVIDFPRRNTARVPLFQAAVEMHSDPYALAILEPLFQTQFLRNTAGDAESEEQQIISSSDEEDTDSDTTVMASTDGQLSRAQQAQLAHTIGDVMLRVDRIADALSYYQTARQLESAVPTRKVLGRKIADARAALRVQRQNAARQPLLHEALEQDRVVRPRLLSRLSSNAKTAVAKGGATR